MAPPRHARAASVNVAYARAQSARPADSPGPAAKTTGACTPGRSADHILCSGRQLWFHLSYPGARQPAQESLPAPASPAFALLRGLNPDSLEARDSHTAAEGALRAHVRASPTGAVQLPLHQSDRTLQESGRSPRRPEQEDASTPPSDLLLY